MNLFLPFGVLCVLALAAITLSIAALFFAKMLFFSKLKRNALTTWTTWT